MLRAQRHWWGLEGRDSRGSAPSGTWVAAPAGHQERRGRTQLRTTGSGSPPFLLPGFQPRSRGRPAARGLGKAPAEHRSLSLSGVAHAASTGPRPQGCCPVRRPDRTRPRASASQPQSTAPRAWKTLSRGGRPEQKRLKVGCAGLQGGGGFRQPRASGPGLHSPEGPARLRLFLQSLGDLQLRPDPGPLPGSPGSTACSALPAPARPRDHRGAGARLLSPAWPEAKPRSREFQGQGQLSGHRSRDAPLRQSCLHGLELSDQRAQSQTENHLPLGAGGLRPPPPGLLREKQPDPGFL